MPLTLDHPYDIFAGKVPLLPPKATYSFKASSAGDGVSSGAFSYKETMAQERYQRCIDQQKSQQKNDVAEHT
jgi:hypothetical protein